MAPPFGDRCRNILCDLGPSGSPYSTRHRRDRCMILHFRSSVHRRGDHFTLRLPAKREYGTQTNISTHTIPRFFVSFVWPNGYFCWGPRTQVERQIRYVEHEGLLRLCSVRSRDSRAITKGVIYLKHRHRPCDGSGIGREHIQWQGLPSKRRIQAVIHHGIGEMGIGRCSIDRTNSSATAL